MSLELIIAILLFFGVATNDQVSDLSDHEARTLYEQQDLDDSRMIDEWIERN